MRSWLSRSFILSWTLLTVLTVNAYDLSFDDALLTNFDELQSTYTETSFDNTVSQFGGLIFWQGTNSIANDVTIEIEGASSTKTCDEQIKWLYFNPQRGARLRPLDEESLEILSWMDGSYSSVKLTWGRYINCDDNGENYIYGQITHTRNGLTYRLVAGVEMSGDIYLQHFEGNLIYEKQIWSGYFFDSWWGFANSVGTGIPDTTVDPFSFPMINNADLEETYMSDEVEIEGLSDGIQVLVSLAELSKGALYINDDYVGQTWYVANWDIISIELISSNEYETIVSATLFVGVRSEAFYIMTKNEDDRDDNWDLTMSQKFMIMNIFKQITDTYDGDDEQLMMFLYTFKSMLEDKIDMTDNGTDKDALEYLLEVMESHMMNSFDYEDIMDIGWNNSLHIAPNCKRYEIAYNEDRMAYFSPNFMVMHYFVSIASLKAYVDEKNPGNGACGTTYGNDPQNRTRRVAPNGKQYTINKTNQWYTSLDFIWAKAFDSLEAIRRYIDYNNPKIEVWDHEVDTEWESETYTSPNGKEYKINKVIQNGDVKYMSYTFIYPKYFDTLEALKNYVDEKNPAPEGTSSQSWTGS